MVFYVQCSEIPQKSCPNPDSHNLRSGVGKNPCLSFLRILGIESVESETNKAMTIRYENRFGQNQSIFCLKNGL